MPHIFASFFIVSVAFSHVCAGQSSQACGNNSEMTPCGSLCERTCLRQAIKNCTPGDPAACENECRCVDGYVRNEETGQCVLVADCPTLRSPQGCPANENMTLCGRICEPTCKNPGPDVMSCPSKACTKDTQDCRCDNGYVRNGDTGGCVRLENCPPARRNETCPDNEHLAICGRNCEPSCKNPSQRRSTSCADTECTKLTKACRCDKGYVRDTKTMKCVRRRDCAGNTMNCPDNEQIGLCGKTCEATCFNQDTARCAGMGCDVSGCQCKQGFFRNEETNKCVPLEDCQISSIQKRCAHGEIFATCGRMCEATCRKPYLPRMCKRVRCSKKGCRCDFSAGFVYDTASKKCVWKQNCPYRPNKQADSSIDLLVNERDTTT